MYGRQFLYIAQTIKRRVEEDDEALYVHSPETHSFCWHSTNVLSSAHTYVRHISSPLQRNHKSGISFHLNLYINYFEAAGF